MLATQYKDKILSLEQESLESDGKCVILYCLKLLISVNIIFLELFGYL